MTTPTYAVVWTGEKLVKVFFEPPGLEDRLTAGAILLVGTAKEKRAPVKYLEALQPTGSCGGSLQDDEEIELCGWRHSALM